MALLAMAVYDTHENGRTPLTERTLNALNETVDWRHHRLAIIDNGSCPETADLLSAWDETNGLPIKVFWLDQNYGTAKAINHAWRTRRDHEVAVKLDNDVVIHQPGWLDTIEECFRRDPKLGILGLKRKDLAECPWAKEPFFRSTLEMLPHEPGERWLAVEKVQHVMGTCQAYRPELLQKIGFLEQMGGLYGFDDALSAIRCQVAGFYSAFLLGVDIDHIDPGTTPYQLWKERYALEMMAKYNQFKAEYLSGRRSIYSASGW